MTRRARRRSTDSREADINSPTSDLGSRERELVETVFRLREASVAEVRASLADPPSYSAVRTMLGRLASKGVVCRRREGRRYLYSPAQEISEARGSVVRHVIDTFFRGSEEDLVTMLLRRGEAAQSPEYRERLLALIESLDDGEPGG